MPADQRSKRTSVKLARYFVFPRTELNRVSASSYNQVSRISVSSEQVSIFTWETKVPDLKTTVAVREFPPQNESAAVFWKSLSWLSLFERGEQDTASEPSGLGRVSHGAAECR